MKHLRKDKPLTQKQLDTIRYRLTHWIEDKDAFQHLLQDVAALLDEVDRLRYLMAM